MEKEFIPYEQALILKELGFDELCLARFDGGGFRMLPAYAPLKNSEIKEAWFCVAPLYQQAFDWFRIRYNINPQIAFCEYSIQSCNGWSFTITNPTKRQNWIGKYKSYEEAKLECLKFLITKITNEESNI